MNCVPSVGLNRQGTNKSTGENMSDYKLNEEQVAKKVTETPNITTNVKTYKDDKGREWVIVETTMSKWYSKKFFDALSFEKKK